MQLLQEDKHVWIFANPSKLYAPETPAATASDAASALRPMSLNSVTDIGASLVTNWAASAYKGHMAYIRCTQDQLNSVEYQDMNLKHTGGDWIVHSMDSGHSPFLSCPAELAKIIVSLAEKLTSD